MGGIIGEIISNSYIVLLRRCIDIRQTNSSNTFCFGPFISYLLTYYDGRCILIPLQILLPSDKNLLQTINCTRGRAIC